MLLAAGDYQAASCIKRRRRPRDARPDWRQRARFFQPKQHLLPRGRRNGDGARCQWAAAVPRLPLRAHVAAAVASGWP